MFSGSSGGGGVREHFLMLAEQRRTAVDTVDIVTGEATVPASGRCDGVPGPFTALRFSCERGEREREDVG